MIQYKRFLKIVIILLIINIAFSSCLNANSKKSYNDYNSKVIIITHFKSKDNCHFISYIKSGRVEHRNYRGDFIFIYPIKLGNGIGHIGVGRNFTVNLKGEGREIRLRVHKIPGLKIYNKDISVNINGFIGVFQPTGGLSGGYLFGFALITKITPLYNQ
jgi:hypothetical protein